MDHTRQLSGLRNNAMPIYAYKCLSCGFEQDVLRKISDAPLTVCPSCGKATFDKQLTAAGFQLKGSGWYATDFKGGSRPTAAETNTDANKGTVDAKSDAKSDTKPDTKSDTKPDTKTPADPSKTSSKPAELTPAPKGNSTGPGNSAT